MRNATPPASILADQLSEPISSPMDLHCTHDSGIISSEEAALFLPVPIRQAEDQT